MMDSAHLQTDDMIERMERKIKKEYNQARKETQTKLNRYLAQVAAGAEEQKRKYEAGEITAQEYQDWMIRKMAMGKRWEELRDNLADDMNNANKIARSISGGYRADAYALNHNFAIYQCEHDGKCSTVYQLYDRHTVERLLEKDRDLMPPPGKKMSQAIREGRAAKWNKQNLQSALTQSILQGEGITDIAERVANAVTVRNMVDAVRYGRTMITGAQNAGRQDGYEHAQDLGIKLQKEWIATLDDRTRASHAELHGERVPVDEKFSNGLMYPGDPSGADEEVWNCRCTTKASVEGFERDKVESSPKMGEMSFDEWLKSRGAGQAEDETSTTPFESDLLKRKMGGDYQAFAEKVSNSANRVLYDKWSDTANDVMIIPNAGVYSPRSKTIRAGYETKREGMDKYSTVAHEYGHHFDHEAGRVAGLGYNEVDTINKRCVIGSGRVKLIEDTPSSCDEFMSALRSDMESLRGSVRDRSIRQTFLESQRMRNATGSIQDALDGFYSTQKNNVLPWGHGDAYYNKYYNQRVKGFGLEKDLKGAFQELGFDASNQTKVKRILRQYRAANEAWANVSSAVTCGGDELDAVEKYMPSTVAAYKKIVDVVGG